MPTPRFVLACLAAICGITSTASASTVILAWDPSPSTVAGYRVHYGRAPGSYSTTVDVGNRTSATLDLADGYRYYFTVSAYTSSGLSSTMSNEITEIVTDPVPLRRIADLTGDGSSDLLWQHAERGWLAYWQMNGLVKMSDGFLSPGVITDPDWRVAGMADMDIDGQADLIWRHATRGTLAVWLLNGTTRVQDYLLTPSSMADLNWEIRAVQDLSNDGRPDLIWQNRVTGALSAWVMEGTRQAGDTFLSPSRISDPNWLIAAVGDMNGDGKNDIIWQHETRGLVVIWLMDGPVRQSEVLLSADTADNLSWHIRALADLDRDGELDLVWQNDATGGLAGWLMSGTRYVRGTVLQPSRVLDPGWRIMGPR